MDVFGPSEINNQKLITKPKRKYIKKDKKIIKTDNVKIKSIIVSFN